jgi:uroporphyrinogen decarboxylase
MTLDRLTHRQRILTALDHQQPDRIPLDLGSTIVTGVSCKAYGALRNYLGLEPAEIKIFDRIAQVAVIEDPILDLFQIDTRGVIPGQPENVPAIEIEDGFIDEWGLARKLPAGADSYFICNAPMAGELTLDAILHYPWPNPSDPGRVHGLVNRIKDLRTRGDWAILLSLPGNFIATSSMLRGFEDWFIDSALNPELLAALMDQVLDIQMEMCATILKEAGDLVDIVVNLDDLATQDRMLVSMPVYRRLLEPRLHKFYEFVRKNTRAKILHHTDGAVEPLMNSLIELGVDAVNPLQVSAKGMGDVASLKNKYGSRLSFWGGIDTQHLLPFGLPADVKTAVREIKQSLNVSGGYVLTSVHNIQNDVPPQNIVAMFEAALDVELIGPDHKSDD